MEKTNEGLFDDSAIFVEDVNEATDGSMNVEEDIKTNHDLSQSSNQHEEDEKVKHGLFGFTGKKHCPSPPINIPYAKKTKPVVVSSSVLMEKLQIINNAKYSKEKQCEMEHFEYARHYEFTNALKQLNKAKNFMLEKRLKALNVILLGSRYIDEIKLNKAMSDIGETYKEEIDIINSYHIHVAHYKVSPREIEECIGQPIKFGDTKYTLYDNKKQAGFDVAELMKQLLIHSQFKN